MPFHSKTWSVLVCLILTVGLVFGTIHFRLVLPVTAFFIGTAVLTALVWLVKRGGIEKVGLPKTGLEIPLLIFWAAVSTSLIFSPAPRIGLEKLAWYLSGGFLFYMLVDILEHSKVRSGLRAAILIVTGIVLLAALLETYAVYLNWWEQAGSRSMPPFQVRFISLLGHANIFMALMNLAAPIALMMFIRTDRRATRVLCAFWLVMYALALPFSSSRGGWLGAAGWVGILIFLWLAEGGRWKTYLGFLRQRLAVAISGGLAVLLLGGYAAIRFYLMFAGSHPSHGSGLNLNREGIWSSALESWQASPWLGTGVGQLGVDLLRVTQAFPARWFPVHAHSTPLQVLGETGLVGFLSFLLLSSAALFVLMRAYRAASHSERPWTAVSLAALTGAVVHGVFDDFTTYPVLMIPPVVHAAFLTAARGPVERFKRVPLLSLVVPGFVVVLVTFNYIWGLAPHYAAASQDEITDWRQAAQASAESARRDPAMPFYYSQTAFAYAMAWLDDADPDDLESARQYLKRALEIESNNSVFWADLAVLNWHAGLTDQAISAIQQAIELCPWDPSNAILYGWFLEQSGEQEEALQQYQSALVLNPRMANHPYWMASTLRSQAIEMAGNGVAPNDSYWALSLNELAAGNLSKAQYQLALSSLNEESPIAVSSTRASLESQKGDLEDTRQRLEEMAAVIDSNYWDKGGGVYYFLFLRQSYPTSVVPGYIRVTEDFGQFENLQRLLDLQLAAGECEDAAFTWQVFQRELHAGELVPGGYPPMPVCPPAQQGG